MADGELHCDVSGLREFAAREAEAHQPRRQRHAHQSWRQGAGHPFVAKLGETYRFFAESSTDNADLAGTWDATFTDEKGETSKAILLLEQSHDHVTGSAMTPTGDHRFLEGQVHGDELQLSTFAGGLAYLYKLKIGANGALAGDYWQGLASHEKVVASRNDSATLNGAGKQTTLRDSAQPLAFTFPDVDGKPVSLSDERFGARSY